MLNQGRYAIKFKSTNSYLKIPTSPYSNYYSDHASHYDTDSVVRLKCKLSAKLLAFFLGGDDAIVIDFDVPILYEEGKTYERINGKPFFVAKCKNELRGYETICDEFEKHRYNRSTGSRDNGRITGSKWTDDCLKYPPVEYKGK